MGRKSTKHKGLRPSLHEPTIDDLDDLHAMLSDPRLWWNIPGFALTSIGQTRTILTDWIDDWHHHGIGGWVIRDNTGGFIGAGGLRRYRCGWDISYGITPSQWHRGYAGYVARCARRAATHIDADAPMFITVLSGNVPAYLIAERLGFVVVRTDIDTDACNASRRIYADRPVRQETVAAYLRDRQSYGLAGLTAHSGQTTGHAQATAGQSASRPTPLN